jgi:nicotinamide riboside transporter PnuC
LWDLNSRRPAHQSKGRAAVCYHLPMTSGLRALASLIVGLMTVVGMVVYQHYSREPPSDGVTVAVTTAASILAWLVTGLE